MSEKVNKSMWRNPFINSNICFPGDWGWSSLNSKTLDNVWLQMKAFANNCRFLHSPSDIIGKLYTLMSSRPPTLFFGLSCVTSSGMYLSGKSYMSTRLVAQNLYLSGQKRYELWIDKVRGEIKLVWKIFLWLVLRNNNLFWTRDKCLKCSIAFFCCPIILLINNCLLLPSAEGFQIMAKQAILHGLLLVVLYYVTGFNTRSIISRLLLVVYY